MQKVGYLLFLLGAGGMDSTSVTVPAVMVLSGLGIIGVTVWRERRKEHYDKTGINSQGYCGDLQRVRRNRLQNNKTA